MRRRAVTVLVSSLALIAGAAANGSAEPSAAASTPIAMAAKASAGSHPLPSKDPFYRYQGPRPLRLIQPGTVLKQRRVRVSLGTNTTPVPAEQLLYRTTDERHHPAVTVTTVITPSTTTGVPRIVGYLSFYDALGPECDPSYTLTGGYAGTQGNEQQAQEEEAIISGYLSEGDTLTVPDFEGTHLHWDAGQESGFGTLDGIRATEHALHLPVKTTPVALTGYSGGSIAADWASELAPRYSPAVDLVGVAEGGIPVDQWHNLRYINGSKVWSGVIPAVLVANSRAFGIRLRRYLSARGRRITHQVRNECIGSFNGAYPGLTIQSLVKPRYRHYKRVPFFVRIVNHLIMGSTRGHPTEPLFMAVGNADGTGDGVMVAKDVQALAYEYCRQGVPVTFNEYNGDSHTQAAVPFTEKAVTFVQDRLDGVPFQAESCSTIGKGNTLRPVRLRRHHQRR